MSAELGLVHRWQAPPTNKKAGSPFPSGHAVCACNSLAVQCPKTAIMWDHQANQSMTPDNVTVQSCQVAYWKAPSGRQWQQRVDVVVGTVRRHRAKLTK